MSHERGQGVGCDIGVALVHLWASGQWFFDPSSSDTGTIPTLLSFANVKLTDFPPALTSENCMNLPDTLNLPFTVVHGDLHGNALYLLQILFIWGAVSCATDEVKGRIQSEFLEMCSYRFTGLWAAAALGSIRPADSPAFQQSLADIQKLRGWIASGELRFHPRGVKIILIGDVFCDRGPSDPLTMVLLLEAWKAGLDIKINFSNHDLFLFRCLSALYEQRTQNIRAPQQSFPMPVPQSQTVPRRSTPRGSAADRLMDLEGYTPTSVPEVQSASPRQIQAQVPILPPREAPLRRYFYSLPDLVRDPGNESFFISLAPILMAFSEAEKDPSSVLDFFSLMEEFIVFYFRNVSLRFDTQLLTLTHAPCAETQTITQSLMQNCLLPSEFTLVSLIRAAQSQSATDFFRTFQQFYAENGNWLTCYVENREWVTSAGDTKCQVYGHTGPSGAGKLTAPTLVDRPVVAGHARAVCLDSFYGRYHGTYGFVYPSLLPGTDSSFQCLLFFDGN